MENWYLQTGEAGDIVVSTRIRLARNIRSIPFQAKETKEDARKLYERIKEILPSIDTSLKLIRLEELDEITIQSLIEKHLIPSDFVKQNHPYAALAINQEENISILINEEDHIKIQAFAAGVAFEETYQMVTNIDEKLDALLDYACDEQFGYLTSHPNHVGTGMKVSVLIHLPGLRKTGNIQKMLQMISSYGFSVSGNYGENSEARNDFYQIASIQSLGISENNILKNCKAITDKVIEQERTARKYLLKKKVDFEDPIFRAFGTLLYAKKITAKEAEELLSEIKLGTDLGIIDELTDRQIRKLQIYLKSGNMQKLLGERLDLKQREEKRPDIIQKIKNEK